ncbi:MAG TPA: hypothetical protein VGI73_14790 [Solirubrobacterales bacterium]
MRLLVAVVGFALVTLVTALVAHPRIFTGFANYDDEGYMLTALKGFVNHGHLYDDVFTQYGPFYYEWWGGIFSLFGIAVTHDAGRTTTMIVWVVSGLLFGLSTWRMTGSIVLGLGTQIVAFGSLGVLTNEPMHPVGIIALLLSVIVAISCFVRERESPYAIALLGAAVAALVLVKINVGAFAVISVALACAVSYRPLWERRWPRLVLEAAFVAIPVLLMLGKFSQEWARHYAFHVAIAAFAAVLALRAREPGRRPAPELGWLVGGFVVLAAVSLLAILGAGTSLHGLVDGVIRQPLRQADAFTIPMNLASRFWGFDVVALGAAVAYWYAARRPEHEPGPAWRAAWSLFAIGVGVTMALSVSGPLFPFNSTSATGFPLSMLAFAWVGLIVVPGGNPATSFARLLLPLLAVLQALHGYPVAGSQILLSAVLLVPVGALCIANGARGLFQLIPAGAERTALAGLGAVLVVVLGWFIVNAHLREQLEIGRGNYNGGVALDLPGASEVHLSEEEVQTYRAVADAIRRDCPATLMEPGMDSFYLWSGQEPPSYTATGWETLFDEAHQRKVIEDTESISGLCLLRNPAIQLGWGEKEGILTRYLEQGFTPIGKWGEYELLRREGTGGAES